MKNEEVLVAGGAFTAQRKVVQKTKVSYIQRGIGGRSAGLKLRAKAFNNRRRN